MIEFRCIGCKEWLTVAEELADRPILCRHCDKRQIAPKSSEIPTVEEVHEIPTVEAVRPQRQKRARRILATGKTGEVELLEHSIIIRRKGFLAWSVQGFRGDKEILLSAITGIEFRTGNWATLGRGSIRFLYMGSNDQRHFTGLAKLNDAASDENAVVFASRDQNAFIELKEAIEKRLAVIRQGRSGATSAADEIKKLASLRDRGIISEMDFEKKKRDLLDA
jgi:hypothetical protein